MYLFPKLLPPLPSSFQTKKVKTHTLGVSKDHHLHSASKLGQGQQLQRAPEVMVVR
jgi:hypothetical protein